MTTNQHIDYPKDIFCVLKALTAFLNTSRSKHPNMYDGGFEGGSRGGSRRIASKRKPSNESHLDVSCAKSPRVINDGESLTFERQELDNQPSNDLTGIGQWDQHPMVRYAGNMSNLLSSNNASRSDFPVPARTQNEEKETPASSIDPNRQIGSSTVDPDDKEFVMAIDAGSDAISTLNLGETDPTSLLNIWKFTCLGPRGFDIREESIVLLSSSGNDDSLEVFLMKIVKLKEDFGAFPAVLVLLDYARCQNLQKLLDLFDLALSFADKLQYILPVLQHSILLLIQNKISEYVRLPETFQKIPLCIKSQLDIKSIASQVEERTAADSMTMKKLRQKLSDLLVVIVHQTLEDENRPQVLDDSYNMDERRSFWTLLISSFVSSFTTCDTNLETRLLLTAQAIHHGTCKYLTVLHDDIESNLHLHPFVLSRYTDKLSPTPEKVQASIDDIRFVVDLLYIGPNGFHRAIEAPVTLGILGIVQALELHNPWEFLFGRNQSEEEVLRRATIQSAIPIATKLKRPTYLQSFWKKATGQQRRDAFIGLEVDDICYFLSIFRIKEIIKYRMLLIWSHGKANLVWKRSESMMFHESVGTWFNKVKVLLQLEMFSQVDLQSVLLEGYITYNDVCHLL